MSGVFLVRHGETATPGLFLGRADPPLSAEGCRQAGRLADELAVPRTLVSSGLRRAVETAAILAGRWGVEVQVDSRLNEIGYGAWDGLSWEEIERRWPRQAAVKLTDWWATTPPDGEPVSSFTQRLADAWTDLRQAERPVVVVAHAGVNAILAELFQGDGVDSLDWDRILRQRQGLGGWTEL